MSMTMMNFNPQPATNPPTLVGPQNWGIPRLHRKQRRLGSKQVSHVHEISWLFNKDPYNG